MVEQHLTPAQVADVVRVSPATLYRQRYVTEAPGSLGFRVGRHVRFDADDLADWIRQRKEHHEDG